MHAICKESSCNWIMFVVFTQCNAEIRTLLADTYVCLLNYSLLLDFLLSTILPKLVWPLSIHFFQENFCGFLKKSALTSDEKYEVRKWQSFLEYRYCFFFFLVATSCCPLSVSQVFLHEQFKVASWCFPVNYSSTWLCYTSCFKSLSLITAKARELRIRFLRGLNKIFQWVLSDAVPRMVAASCSVRYKHSPFGTEVIAWSLRILYLQFYQNYLGKCITS